MTEQQHPLTDEMIDQIQVELGGPCFQCYEDMRHAYDKGSKDMLEQVIGHMLEARWFAAPRSRLAELRAAMRPQQENNS